MTTEFNLYLSFQMLILEFVLMMVFSSKVVKGVEVTQYWFIRLVLISVKTKGTLETRCHDKHKGKTKYLSVSFLNCR